MRILAITAWLISLALGSASCTILVDPAPPAAEFQRFERDWGWGPCPPGEDCSGSIELTAGGILRLDLPCPSDMDCSGMPAGTYQTTVSAADLDAAVATLTDPDLIRLLDQPAPPCPAPTDIGESMTLVMDDGTHANATTLCEQAPLVAAREALASLVPVYFGEPSPDIELVSGGWSFGLCLGGCRGGLAFDDDMVQYTILDWRPVVPPYLDNTGVLTEQGRHEIDSILAELAGVTLEEVYGCPDCADGGASQVTLARGGDTSTHTYEYANPPAALAELDALLVSLMNALETCSASPLIDIASDCVPRGE